MPQLSDRLKSLGVKVGAKDLPPPKPLNPYSIERVLLGNTIETHFGDTFLVENRYPDDYTHGLVPLWNQSAYDPIAAWAQDERIRSLAPHSFAFIDTETTGLSGGTGTYAFLIGVGRFEGKEFHLAQYFMRDPAEEPAQLAALEEFIAPCDALVSFNGKSFDIPLLNTRYLTHGWRPPFVEQAHVDMLHLARRLWRDRLPSRTLPNLEYHILGAVRTEEDVPGWMIPQMYFDYLRSGDARPLKNVFYHNAMDVVSLAALFTHTSALLSAPHEQELAYGVDVIAMAKLFEDLGDIEMADSLYQRGLDSHLQEHALLEALYRRAMMHKRQGDLSQAEVLWIEAAHHAHLEAHIELAKYYEHRIQDYTSAIQWAEQALLLIEGASSTAYEVRRWQTELEHRLTRLRRKIHE